MVQFLPSIGEEVDFDIRVPGPPVFPGGQVFGAQNGDNQLMAYFVIPQFDLQGQSRDIIQRGFSRKSWLKTLRD